MHLRSVRLGLGATDLLVIVWATLGAEVIRFGVDDDATAATVQGLTFGYTTFSLLLAVVWWLVLRVHGLCAVSILGHGTVEYRLICSATFQVFAGVALISYAFQIQVARGYVLVALPAGLLGLLLARKQWRGWLGAQRAAGHLNRDVLVVGDPGQGQDLIRAFARVPAAGYRVVGLCSSTTDAEVVDGVPVLCSEHAAARTAMELGVDVVACCAANRLGVTGLRRLAWSLEGSGIDLVVSPGLTEVAGPRVVSRPVSGLPLLLVEVPQFSGPKLLAKTVIDWLGAMSLLIILSPLMIVVAIIIKAHDGGRVLFTQVRVGLDGQTFRMTKFRSMVPDAERRLADLKALQEETRARADGADGDGVGGAGVDRGVLFKMENDPRVTPVGRFIRRYSIDELPQLFDVVTGKMSLVGPRPPLPSEVSNYEHDVHRRLLVKPGMTGLWQVNGRSNLSWEESVRFDLYYVENWSVALDGVILWRTLAAVVGKDGAY